MFLMPPEPTEVRTRVLVSEGVCVCPCIHRGVCACLSVCVRSCTCASACDYGWHTSHKRRTSRIPGLGSRSSRGSGCARTWIALGARCLGCEFRFDSVHLHLHGRRLFGKLSLEVRLSGDERQGVGRTWAAGGGALGFSCGLYADWVVLWDPRTFSLEKRRLLFP